MATTTTTNHYRKFPASGIYPPDTGRVYYVYEDDEANLDVINDIAKYAPIAVDVAVTEVGVELGDFDSGSAAVHSVILNNGTTEYEVIRLVTIGQAGGVSRLGDGTTPELTPIGIKAPALSYLGIKTTTAPATATTTGRKVVLWWHAHAAA